MNRFVKLFHNLLFRVTNWSDSVGVWSDIFRKSKKVVFFQKSEKVGFFKSRNLVVFFKNRKSQILIKNQKKSVCFSKFCFGESENAKITRRKKNKWILHRGMQLKKGVRGEGRGKIRVHYTNIFFKCYPKLVHC